MTHSTPKVVPLLMKGDLESGICIEGLLTGRRMVRFANEDPWIPSGNATLDEVARAREINMAGAQPRPADLLTAPLV